MDFINVKTQSDNYKTRTGIDMLLYQYINIINSSQALHDDQDKNTPSNGHRQVFEFH